MQDVATISFCGRPIAAVAPLLQPGARVLALSADGDTPRLVANFLDERGFGATRIHVMEALGGAHEAIHVRRADAFETASANRLNLLALEVACDGSASVIPLVAGRPDALYEHDGQLTRREVRAVTLSSLAPRQGERLWDVGGGAGSVGIEWMLSHPANTAITIEPNAARVASIGRNAGRLGVHRRTPSSSAAAAASPV